MDKKRPPGRGGGEGKHSHAQNRGDHAVPVLALSGMGKQGGDTHGKRCPKQWHDNQHDQRRGGNPAQRAEGRQGNQPQQDKTGIVRFWGNQLHLHEQQVQDKRDKHRHAYYVHETAQPAVEPETARSHQRADKKLDQHDRAAKNQRPDATTAPGSKHAPEEVGQWNPKQAKKTHGQFYHTVLGNVQGRSHCERKSVTVPRHKSP